VTILLLCFELEMAFSSHIMQGTYSLIIEFYWAQKIASVDLENEMEKRHFTNSFSLFMGSA